MPALLQHFPLLAHPHVVSGVKRSVAIWGELLSDDAADVLDRPDLTRQTHHYGSALGLAYMVCDGVTVSDPLLLGDASGFSFLLNMFRLFEDFVATLLDRLFTGAQITVSRQAADWSILWNPDTNRSFGHVRPDVLLRSQDGALCLPIDAKYKDYGEKRFQPGDLYQATVYALALATRLSSSGFRHCVLVHPVVAGDGSRRRPLRVQVRAGASGTAEVAVIGVDVGAVLDGLVAGVWYTGVEVLREELDRVLGNGRLRATPDAANVIQSVGAQSEAAPHMFG